jgi:hypothetical protein
MRRKLRGTKKFDPGRVGDCDLTLQTSHGWCGSIWSNVNFDVASIKVSAG